ncbi:SIR2 family protein [Deinococcus ruber]|uniref:Deacetylase sirtuin-type domain-containing protein n=1 Tax=Deinococcus ruber TaxID=1848197 RepID=A0A918FAY9_9DEIO|nr:SIR2 family protein [Deinococcus ruber]GGR17437.1 hypothetical protein GCM10008957_32670 [Deinococcus ruber]
MSLPPNLAELAVSMHHNPGVYALLLGSGLSLSAGIPTAWGIVENLIRQLAVTNGVSPLPEGDALFTWYRDTYSTEASYSDLITRIEPTQAGQHRLLRGYFEQQNADGQLVPHAPSPAHRAIAQLCQAGLLRVIVTTNFDRLLEQALADVHVIPTVISNAQEIPAAPPLVHGGVFILKLHGDYLKDDVRNSVADLEQYPADLQAYLNRILDEFGLIVCGWSGEWDHALRNSILNTPNRRYPLVWSAYREPSAKAKELIDARRGHVVTGLDADSFFNLLEGRVLALRDLHYTPPRDAAALAAEVKRFMANPLRDGARLTDLIERTCDDLKDAIHGEARPPAPDEHGIRRGLEWSVNVSVPLLHVLGAVLKYDRAGTWTATLREALTRIDWDVHMLPFAMTDTERQLRRLPVLLIGLAAAGLGAAYDKPEILTFLQADPYRQPNMLRYSPVEALLRSNSLDDLVRTGDLSKGSMPVRYWAADVLMRELAPYLNPATALEDLRVGELLVALIALDEVVSQRFMETMLNGRAAVTGTQLYRLQPQRGCARLLQLFKPGLEDMQARLGLQQDRRLLAAAYDQAAVAAFNPRYDFGTEGFRAEMAALVSSMSGEA